MKKGIVKIFLFFAMLCLCPALKVEAEGNFYITNYDFYAVVHEDNTVSVSEDIDVHFTAPSHGIYRSLITSYSLERDISNPGEEPEYRDMNYVLDYKKIHVDDWKYSKSSEDGDTYIKIGDENRYVNDDEHYHITFTTVIPDDRLKNGDFFYYDVLGSAWESNVQNFSFQVDFDKPLSDTALENMYLYSGDYTIANALNVQYDYSNNSIYGYATDIPPKNSITLFIPLEEGYFVGAKQLGSPILMWIFFALSIIAALATIITALNTHHDEIVKTIQFYPPEGISPAEVGTIIDESADEVDMLALIPWFASKRYISISEKPNSKGLIGKSTELHLKKEQGIPPTAPAYMKTFFDGLFDGKNEVEVSKLSSDFYTKYVDAKKKLKEYFSGKKTLSTGNAKAILCSILVLILLAAQLISANKEDPSQECVMAVFFIAVGIWQSVRGNIAAKRTGIEKAYKKFFKNILSIILVLFLILMFSVTHLSNTYNSYFSGINYISLALGIAAVLLSNRMISNTPYRVEMMGKLLGLKEFIETAELERLQMLANENPEYFYDIIPYAMVLGLDGKWAKKFENIKIPQPSWYSPYDNTMMYSSLYFHNHMHNSLMHSMEHTVATEAAKAARASGSGGGGFSGGGAGGGGGGSW